MFIGNQWEQLQEEPAQDCDAHFIARNDLVPLLMSHVRNIVRWLAAQSGGGQQTHDDVHSGRSQRDFTGERRGDVQEKAGFYQKHREARSDTNAVSTSFVFVVDT